MWRWGAGWVGDIDFDIVLECRLLAKNHRNINNWIIEIRKFSRSKNAKWHTESGVSLEKHAEQNKWRIKMRQQNSPMSINKFDTSVAARMRTGTWKVVRQRNKQSKKRRRKMRQQKFPWKGINKFDSSVAARMRTGVWCVAKETREQNKWQSQ